MKKLLHTALSPNAEADDIQLAWNTLKDKSHYQTGVSLEQLQNKLATYFDNDAVWLVNSGRSALYLILKSLQLQPDDEVLVQAYTCNAVPNPVLWVGVQPRYVDIDPGTLTMSPAALIAAITPHSKVLVIQHTFGQPADLDALLDIAKAHHLFIIEDCAHALGSRYHNQLVGTFGDAAIFSFGRDKVISSIYGGVLLVNAQELKPAVAKVFETFSYPTIVWIKQQLWHPIILSWAKTTWYWFGFGRLIILLAKRWHWISLAVTAGERKGEKPDYFPARLPAALAVLALHQFNKLERLNSHRRNLAKIYHDVLNPAAAINLEQSTWLRYTLNVPNPPAMWRAFKNLGQAQGSILGDWYWQPIAPAGSDLAKLHYQSGQCPHAETAAAHSLNLPTHIDISEQQAERLAKQVAAYLQKSTV